MRRPLKPFVTEYKGNNRRQKDGTGVFGVELDASQPEDGARQIAKTSEPKTPTARHAATGQPTRRGDTPRDPNRANESARFAGPQGEDSYEAALRAADALFSGAPARAGSTPGVVALTQDVFAEAASPTGGRILRVIDEAPDTALADIEAERAPKRRGRKPGSKNKPKVPSAPQYEMPTLRMGAEPDDDGSDNDNDPVFRFQPTPAPAPSSLPRPSSPNVYPVIPSRGDRRFSWIKTKLGPGEQWKRRLPKLIW